MTDSSSAWIALVVLTVSEFDVIFIFSFNKEKESSVNFNKDIANLLISLPIYRGNSKGDSEADGHRWADHISCEKSFAGRKASQKTWGFFFSEFYWWSLSNHRVIFFFVFFSICLIEISNCKVRATVRWRYIELPFTYFSLVNSYILLIFLTADILTWGFPV